MSSARSHIESALSEARASNNLAAYEHLSKALNALDRSASSSSSAPRMEYEGGSAGYGSDDRGTNAHTRRGSRRHMDRDDDASSAREDDHGRDDRFTYTDDYPYPPPRHHHHHRHRPRSSSSSSRSSSNNTFDPLTATLGTVLGLGLLGSIFSPLTAVYPVAASSYPLSPGESLYIY
ncbi:hypothetical protein I350_06138 [Cryptococcus amylolentus CBS 6273]|uniref:Uncharacterized protein n=1 Tax=Cryptococcus amylolentus CBS 6273 TaxID=1296118 RepID=A0A1E3JQY0_9TREE|nr:hypothetical protein I350_06138 [Cryptococcus amylolentus CBS 6273]